MRKLQILAILLLSLSTNAQDGFAYNSSFELSKGVNKFYYWTFYNHNGQYVFNADKSILHSGKTSLFVDGSRAVRGANDDESGLFYTELPFALLRNKKKIKVVAWVKLEDVVYASVWIQQLTSSGQHIESGYPDTINKIEGWQQVHLETTVDTAVTALYFGGLLNGNGKAVFDDFEVYLDGVLVPDIAKPVALPTPSEIAWIQKNSFPLLSVSGNSNYADMAALFRLAPNATIVALGEPTHGTGDVFSLRLKMLSYLVEQKGFNTFMIEDELPEAGLLNDYVLYGKDTALKLVKKNLFPVWRTEELLELIEWMRSYNMTHTEKLQFRGMDIQSTRVARQILLAFGLSNDTALYKMAIDMDAIYKRLIANKVKENRPPIRDSLVSLSKNVQFYFNQHFDRYRKYVSIDTLNWVQLNINVIAQSYNNLDWDKASYYRDSCMAKNIIDYVAQYPNTKMLIWAHNSHVSRAKGMMGKYLASHFGQKYYTIGFATSYGTYTASVDFPKTAWKTYQLEEPYPGTIEYYLQNAGDNYILPVRPVGDGAWLSKKLYMRGVGFMNMDDQFFPTILSEEFDALIYMRNTKHSRSYMLNK